MRIAKCGLGSALIGDWYLADKLGACGRISFTAYVPTVVGQILAVAVCSNFCNW